MPLLGEMDGVLTLDGKLEGSNLLFSSPFWGPAVALRHAVVAGGCLSSLGTGNLCHVAES